MWTGSESLVSRRLLALLPWLFRPLDDGIITQSVTDVSLFPPQTRTYCSTVPVATMRLACKQGNNAVREGH